MNFYVCPLKKVDKVVPPWHTRLYGVIVYAGNTNSRSSRENTRGGHRKKDRGEQQAVVAETLLPPRQGGNALWGELS